MSAAQDYSQQLWGPLQLGHEVNIRGLTKRDLKPTSVHGVIVEMDLRNLGGNKPASFLIVPVARYKDLANDYVGAAPRYFQSACEAVGQRFDSPKIGALYTGEHDVLALSGADAMVYDAGAPISFYQGEHEMLVRNLRPGVITKYRHSPSVLHDVYVKRVRLYPARHTHGQIGMKTELKLNCSRGPSVARDQVPPFEELVYS